MKSVLRSISLLMLVASLLAVPATAAVTVTPASGGTGISADRAANATSPQYTVLGDIVINEGADADFSTGTNVTLVLNPPSGWSFRAGVGSVDEANGRDIDSVSISVTAAAATVTYSLDTITKDDALTIEDLEVRPNDGVLTNTPAGNITRNASSTGTIAGISGATNFGSLSMVVGAAKKLTMSTQPSAAADAGVAFPTQPAVRIEDQFGNLRSADGSTVVTASRNIGSGTAALQGTITATAGAGTATFATLAYNKAETIALDFSAPGLTGTTSGNIVVAAGSPSKLAFSTSPAGAVAGAAFGTQPVIKTADAYDNPTNVGIAADIPISISIATGTGTLLGTTSFNIGSSFGNGTVMPSDLQINEAGPFTLQATGFGVGTSASFTVTAGAPATITKLAGDGQSALVGTILPVDPSVRVEDVFGNDVAGQTVTFAPTAGSGSVAGGTPVTDAAGVATITSWTLGAVGGTHTLEVTAGSAPMVTFTATATCTNTSIASGNWNAPATWAGGCIPGAGDAVTISNGHTVTVTAAAEAASITFAAATVNTSVAINSGITLTVSGLVLVTTPSSAGIASTMNVGDGTLLTGSLELDGGGSRRSVLQIDDGTATVTGALVLSGNQATQEINITGAGTLNIGGDFDAEGSFDLSATATFRFNGTSLQTVGGNNPPDTFSNVVIANDVVTEHQLWIGNTLTINSGKSLDMDAKNLRLDGDLVVDGDLTGLKNVFAEGTVLQTFSGTTNPIAFDSLNLKNDAGLALETSITVASTLTLDGGNITTGANTVTILVDGSVDRTTGHVIGNLAKVFGEAESNDFEVGTANAYSPVTVEATDGTFPATFTAKAVQGAHPNSPTTNALQRYWVLTPGDITEADLDFSYVDLDVVGDEDAYRLARYAAGWSYPEASVDTLTNIASAEGITSFGDFTLHAKAASLVITSVNGGVNPKQESPFTVSIKSLDSEGNDAPVGIDTLIQLSLTTGTGSLGGTLAGTMLAGSNTVVISGVTYDTAESGVVVRATATAGMDLGIDDSDPFTVDPGLTDLTISVEGPHYSSPGDSDNYFFTITNIGLSPATGAQLTRTIPAGWTTPATPDCPAFPCPLGTIAVNQSVTVKIQVKVPASAATSTSYDLTSTVSSSTDDADPSNNSVTRKLKIVDCPVIDDMQPSVAGPVSGTLTWESPQANRFDVYLGPEGSGCSMKIGATDHLSFDYSGLQAGTTYEWMIIASRAGCEPVESACVKFTTPCDPPSIAAVAETTSESTYHVGWAEVPGSASYVLEESSDSTFSAPAATTTAELAVPFHKSVDVATAWYYRVRPAQCGDAWSATLRVVVHPPGSPEAFEFDLVVEHGSADALVQPMLLESGDGPGALSATFTAESNVPWLTVTPSAGTIPGAGVILEAMVDPSGLPLGASTGTISVHSATHALLAQYMVTVHAMPPIQVGGKTPSGAPSWVIPAVAHAAGLNSLWRSDVRIFNPSPLPADYTLHFTPSRTDGSQHGWHTAITIDPETTLALDDIVRHPFGFGSLNESAFGALEVRPVAEDDAGTVITSRTYNDTEAGTYGQFVSAVPKSRFVGAGGRLSLQQLAQSASWRSNIGVVEGSGATVSLLLHIFDASGAELTSIPLSLSPFEHRQIDALLAMNGINSNSARVEVEVVSGDGSVTAYASVIDAATNDPMAVEGTNAAPIHAQRFVVPGVAHFDTPSNHWRSDVRILNAGHASVEATIRFHAQGSSTPLSRTVTLAPGAVQGYDNIVQSLLGTANTHGALHVTTSSASSLVVTARTYDQQEAGTYGQFIPAMTAGDAATLGGAARQILHVEQSARFRSNIGFAEVAGHSARVVVTATSDDGRTGSTIVDLDAYEYRQLGSLLASLGLEESSNARVQVVVTGGGGAVIAYSSTIDNDTQDPTYIPAQ